MATIDTVQSHEFANLRKQTEIKQIDVDPSVDRITCGISWDLLEKKVDLDLTVVALDAYSFEIDAAFYNQTHIMDGAIIHSGDNKTGIGDGDDEQIKIDLRKLPQKCKSLWFVVNCFEGGDFTDVETARFTLYNGSDHSKILYSYGIGMACSSTALLLGVLSCNDPYSADKIWNFRVIESKGSGHNFVESKYLLTENLNILYDEAIVMERPRDRNQKYDLVKGDVYVIDPQISNIAVGLGWDAAQGGQQDIDVDASVIIFKKLSSAAAGSDQFKKIDIVYFGQQEYGGSIKHGGDNTTGEGDGDDETILIDLHRLSKDVDADVLCVVINIWKGADSFKEIENCFARLLDNDRELCRFNLSAGYESKGMIMCRLSKRSNGCWAMITDGVGCVGHKAEESVDDAMKLLSGATDGDQATETHALINGRATGANDVPPQSRSCCVVL